MISTKTTMLATALMALVSAPSHAFWDEMVVGMTSVTNNLIDSTEHVTVSSVNTTSNTVLLLSRDIGKMADRIDGMADKIGVMADRIGVMADRIVLTESMMAGFAHKVVDNQHQLAALQYTQARGLPIESPRQFQAGYRPTELPAATSAYQPEAYRSAYPAAYQPAYQAARPAAYPVAYPPQPAALFQQPAPEPVAARKQSAPATQAPGPVPQRVMQASYVPALQAQAEPDAPHRLRAGNPALNPYLGNALPVAPQVSTRCMAGLNAWNGSRSC